LPVCTSWKSYWSQKLLRKISELSRHHQPPSSWYVWQNQITCEAKIILCNNFRLQTDGLPTLMDTLIANFRHTERHTLPSSSTKQLHSKSAGIEIRSDHYLAHHKSNDAPTSPAILKKCYRT
jgi:hypothetical protein